MSMVLYRRLTGKQEGAGMGCPVGAGHDVVAPNEPVGNVNVSGHILSCGRLLKERRYGDVKARKHGQLIRPLLEAVHIGEGDYLAALEDIQPVVDAGLAAGGQSQVLRHEGALKNTNNPHRY